MDAADQAEMVAGIRDGLAIEWYTDAADALKDRFLNEARDPYDYGLLAGFGAADESEAYARIARAKEEFRAQQVRELRDAVTRARRDYRQAKRTLKGWGED